MRRGLGVAAVALALAGCSSSDDPPREAPAPTRAGVSGPLCDLLPAGDDPGAPASLADEPADVALQWIPVLTTFEAGVRATGLDRELHAADGVTILAPTDDAFAAAFDRRRLDELLLSRHDELRALLRAHIIDGARSLGELLDDGRETTLAGGALAVTAADGMARLNDRATTVCADYAVANARIHVIDGVLR